MVKSMDIVIAEMEFARDYTKSLLETVDESEWFTIPENGCSHLAWQAGHIAMAQYALNLMRIRDCDEDRALMDKSFMRSFMKGTTPVADAGEYPSVSEIRATLDRVHAQCLRVVPTYTEEQLNETLPKPTAGFPTKRGSILFSVMHEMLHAGQIGAIRRGLGKPPVTT